MDWRSNMTKNQIIAKLKTEYPTLTKGVGNEVFELTPAEYSETIEKWADAELAKISEEADIQAKATAKAALLDRLGITAEEAKLLLS
jgi:hypothetical protein